MDLLEKTIFSHVMLCPVAFAQAFPVFLAQQLLFFSAFCFRSWVSTIVWTLVPLLVIVEHPPEPKPDFVGVGFFSFLLLKLVIGFKLNSFLSY